jgi:anaerobic ribonucleoside-triphosphate reductase activating protein
MAVASEPSYGSKDVICTVAAALTQRAIPSILIATSVLKKSPSRFACQGIEGVTFSGGEPFQQAGDLRRLCEYIKLRRPDFSIGVFSGYTLQELVRGRWHWKAPGEDAWIKGEPTLFMAIKQFLDLGVLGRFRQTMACNDKPLCGSRNQEVVFFTNRYSPGEVMPQGFEVTISVDGKGAVITGFPPPSL